METTIVSLGSDCEEFIREKVTQGHYKDANEVIRAGLLLLQKEEDRHKSLDELIKEGINSGIVEDFDPEEHLKDLNERYGSSKLSF
ncbi:MAG: type II toxin-antitoxin system ParD family antitoxin [Mediterranea sp.]|jgi:antitoxin ParD1/3/4|nr:type II toxin-antitoxin system ParD family antitoxin [Mediterranea sp.]